MYEIDFECITKDAINEVVKRAVLAVIEEHVGSGIEAYLHIRLRDSTDDSECCHLLDQKRETRVTTAAALEQARALMDALHESARKWNTPDPTGEAWWEFEKRAIAAALLRAYADGFEDGRNWSRIVTTETLDPPSVFRAAACALERGEIEEKQ